MSLKSLAASNPTPQESIAYGMNLAKFIDWKKIGIWALVLAATVIITHFVW